MSSCCRAFHCWPSASSSASRLAHHCASSRCAVAPRSSSWSFRAAASAESSSKRFFAISASSAARASATTASAFARASSHSSPASEYWLYAVRISCTSTSSFFENSASSGPAPVRGSWPTAGIGSCGRRAWTYTVPGCGEATGSAAPNAGADSTTPGFGAKRCCSSCRSASVESGPGSSWKTSAILRSMPSMVNV